MIAYTFNSPLQFITCLCLLFITSINLISSRWNALQLTPLKSRWRATWDLKKAQWYSTKRESESLVSGLISSISAKWSWRFAAESVVPTLWKMIFGILSQKEGKFRDEKSNGKGSKISPKHFHQRFLSVRFQRDPKDSLAKRILPRRILFKSRNRHPLQISTLFLVGSPARLFQLHKAGRDSCRTTNDFCYDFSYCSDFQSTSLRN